MEKMLKFPDGFLWGSSVSSYQVEGDIDNCDWSSEYPAGKACQYYSRYEKYFDLAKQLNQNAHRFSLEWSRIQPTEEKFDRNEIDHCKKVLKALKDRGIKPMLTIWHWTLPVWFAQMGGWENPKAVEYFQQYAKFVAEELHDLVDYWIILNEPEIYISLAYFAGVFPPKKKNSLKSAVVLNNLSRAHKATYETIHEINPDAKVSSAYNLSFAYPFNKDSFWDASASKVYNYFRNRIFLESTKGYNDFLGINYYYPDRVKANLRSYPFFMTKNENKDVSDLGWDIYPKGIYQVLKSVKKYNLPVYITENGIADAKDKKRARFIREHLRCVHKAIQEEVNVRGYMHWSLIDNFEWTFGYEPRFGLIEVDRETLNTKIRPSAFEYAQICKNNALSV